MAKKKSWSKKLNRSDIAKEVGKRTGLRLNASHRRELNETAEFFGSICDLFAPRPIPKGDYSQRVSSHSSAVTDDDTIIDAEWEEVTE